jgi:spermidine synthase
LTSTTSARQANRFLLYLCFFASGASGLLYEVLWARILGLFFGHTVYAVTTVLAAFMGGLALGSRVFGRISDRVANPLRLYALLEIGTGIFCLAVPDLLAAARGIYLEWAPRLPANVPVLTLARFAVALPVLLIPTTMMGGTIPAVCRHLVRDSSETGRTVGTAYGVNTLGAAFGALSVGYWLIPAIGVRASNHAGVAVSVLAGVSALLLAAKASPAPAGPTGDAGDSAERSADDRLLVAAFAVCGAVGMTFEIVWSRALVLVIGSSTYAYSAILTIFLLGIGLGGILFARLRLQPSTGLFGLLQIGTGAAAFLMIPAFDSLPGLFFALFQSAGGSIAGVLAIQFVIVCLMLLLPTVLSGMTFPCVAALCARRVGTLGGQLGRLYAWNTVGAIAGSIAAGFLLFPLLGAQKTMALGIGTIMLSGTAIIWRSGLSWKRTAAGAIAVVAVIAGLYPRWDPRRMSSGVFYTAARGRTTEDLSRSPIREILYFREGVSSTITVARFDTGVTSLLVNGKVDANNGGDMETQVKSANLPILLHPSPGRIAVIGLGSGVTIGISTLYDAPRRIDVVELEEAVVEASDHFRRENFGALADPRVRLRIDDAASFIDLAKPGYDVIISEPSNPWMAGIGNLYSRDFYRKAREKLAGGGIYCQWLQGYWISPREFRLVLRTFLEVFPWSTLWTGSNGDFLLIGFRDGPPPLLDAWTIDARASRNPRLRSSFRFLGDSPTDSVLASFFLGTRELRAYAGQGEINTDDLPLLEFRAPASLYAGDSFRVLQSEMLALRQDPYPSFFLDPAYGTPESHLRLALLLERKERLGEAAIHREAAVRVTSGKTGAGTSGKRLED